MVKKENNVDIILPNYNSSDFIGQTIDSILKQTQKKWTLIIVDDCSNYKTKKILKHYKKKSKKIKIYWMNKNRGAAYCRNYALRKSSNPLIAFIDSDDVWSKSKLKSQITFMKKRNYSFTYTNYQTFGNKKKFVNNPESLNYFQFIKNTSIPTSTMMIRKNVLNNIKFINTKICEDYFFKCKLLKKIGKAYCLKKYLTKYRIRNNSLQSNNFKNIFWIWKINKNFNKLNLLENIISLLFISINSMKKYGGKNILY